MTIVLTNWLKGLLISRYTFFLLFTLISIHVHAQKILRGSVKDKSGQAIFAANVYPKDKSGGVVTDFEGKFDLKVSAQTDTLFVSFIGYQTKIISLIELDISRPLDIVLAPNGALLSEIVIRGKKVVAEEFSAIEMKSLEIYTNPVASADPLRAITLLPSSTNTGETANPELRGSSADRSVVMYNGTPISNPVRNTQLNGLGFFSLFNTALIKRQIVYGSNPPLIYGNATGGAVEIETIDELKNNQTQFSLGLANTGFLTSQKFKTANEQDFIQLYGNYQFSPAFVGLNREAFDFIDFFEVKDLGVNIRKNIKENSFINWYSYLIDESAAVNIDVFNYKGLTRSSNTRNFNVFNYYLQKGSHIFTFNNRTDFERRTYHFGNTSYDTQNSQVYSSLNYKNLLSKKATLQAGATHDFYHFDIKNQYPSSFYAYAPENPSYFLIPY